MEDCGGMLHMTKAESGHSGGSSVYIMNTSQILAKMVTMDYEGLAAAGSALGTGVAS